MRVVAALAAATLLAACGSSSSSTASHATRAQTETTATKTETVTRTTTTATAPGSRATPQCVAAELRLSSLGQQGGMGHGELGFAVRNTGAQSCRTGGYPGVVFLDAAGRGLPTAPTRVTRDFFGTAPVTRITLAPGQSASFRLGVTHVAQGTATCTTAAGLQIIAPNDTVTRRTTIPNGAYECQAVTVSPLRPGASAYP